MMMVSGIILQNILRRYEEAESHFERHATKNRRVSANTDTGSFNPGDTFPIGVWPVTER